jgi:hypothetical protein
MVNNSTSINKMNNYHSAQIIEYTHKKKTMTYDWGKPGSDLLPIAWAV